MPVKKYRDLAEARRDQWSEGGSDENIRRLRFVLKLWGRLRPKRFPRGVFRYRSIEDANAAAEEWLRTR